MQRSFGVLAASRSRSTCASVGMSLRTVAPGDPRRGHEPHARRELLEERAALRVRRPAQRGLQAHELVLMLRGRMPRALHAST